MQKSKIEVGKEYALRERLKTQEPLQHVRVLENVRGKRWKVEWIEPNPGLVDYVDSQSLIVPWKERTAFLRDEDRERRLRADNEHQGWINDSPMDRAVEQVISSTGEQSLCFYRGVLSGAPEALERVKSRASLDSPHESPYAYVSRHGEVRAPYAEAMRIAKAFCGKEPSAVLARVETIERDWSQEVMRPGKEYLAKLLNEYQASWAIIRQWTGQDAAIAQRESYIQRLERLVWDAVYALQKAGVDDEAKRLRRVLERA